jgi:DNA replication protein DnaC
LAGERICPATGTSVAEAWASETLHLTRLPETLPEPFDVVALRVVGIDGLVSFEGRQYSVPFRFAGERVEVRGCAGTIQVVKDCAVIATHPRATPARLVINQAHYDGAEHGTGARPAAARPAGREDPGAGPLACRAPLDGSLRRLGGGGPMTAPKPKLDIDTTRERLLVLGCSHAAEQLDQVLSEAVRQEIAPHAFLNLLLETELSGREARRVKTSLRLSNLPTGQTLENFDFAFQPAIERSRIDTLATCAWVRTAETVLIQGPPGVGKTHLCVGLGIRAVEQGFSVQYFRFDELMTALKIDAGLPPARLKRRKYMSTALLLIDELGFEPMSRQEASLFFRLVTYRYGRGAILITTNKSVRDWTEVLAGDEVLAAAILDRLLHRAHVLNIKGRSYRLRDLEDALKLSHA